MKSRSRLTTVFVPLTLLVRSSCRPLHRTPEVPGHRKVDHADTYHGTTVPDPYRWLEDDNSAETAEWVKAQNAVTFAYLEKIRSGRSSRHGSRSSTTTPSTARRSARALLLLQQERGLQNQSVLYLQRGSTRRRVLIDPNTWSDDAPCA